MPLPFLKNSIEGRSLDVAGNFAYSDIFFEPFQLGWHPKPADFLVGYSIVIPTGKYSFGSPTNAGLGMVGNLFQAGTTVHLAKQEPWEFSVLSTYAIHGKKRGTDIKVGNVLTFEGGLGYAFYKKQKQKHPIPIDLGIVYYGQFKLTSDQVNGDKHPLVQTLLAGRKDRVYGLGGELDYFIPSANLVLGAHALDELGARNRTQGVTMMFSIGWMAKSFVKKAPPADNP
jgi:hypothetical protein